MFVTSDIDTLRQYIQQEFGYEGDIPADMDLLQKQVLDSFSIVTLAMFVQERFEVILEAEDLVRANLATLSSIVALIARKRS